ncbi:MAG TPA: hypothetical protein PKE69_07885 [Pyrinomonadaceae bacterium]|nr:hypothetical protein [Pyrinomonadaceae bacterium]
MTQNDNLSFYADWLLDLAGEKIEGEDLRNVLATRIKSAEDIERAAREVEISRLVQFLMIKLKEAEIAVPADFEAKLMARVGEDETLLNLLEIYLSGFSRTLIELINALFSFFPESRKMETSAV